MRYKSKSNMQLQNRTTEQIKSDIATLEAALKVPGLPQDEAKMHTDLLARLKYELISRATMKPDSGAKPANFSTPLGRSSLPGNGEPIFAPADHRPTAPSRTILAGNIHATKSDITSSIHIGESKDPHNPTITITWSDGYSITVDESGASGRFKSTLRDCISLKCVDEGRLQKMWRWDTPWRCTGFYQALTSFWGKPPSLKELGITHPTDRQREVFALISGKSLQTDGATKVV